MADPRRPTPPAETDRSVGVRPQKKRRSRPWHRTLGALSALPLVWVVVTGALLNHTVDWKLDQIQLSHSWVLAAYGMSPSGEPVGLRVGRHRIAAWDGRIFLDASPLEIPGRLIGAAADGDGMAVVTDTAVLRVDASGAIVESLDSVSLPAVPLDGVAGHDGRVFLRNADGWHEVGGDWLDFILREGASFPEQTLGPVENTAEKDRLRRAWAAGGLPASRVLLDLHAGRFLGPFGRYFYDFVAVCTLWLCLTGMILFLRKPRNDR